MNKTLLTFIFICAITILSGQNDDLSDQDLTVIKSYQYDIESVAPIMLESKMDMPSSSFSQEVFEVDLLPISMDDATYELKPIAHEIAARKSYKGYAQAQLGTLNNIFVKGSYRHQVPNYFMYGVDASYHQMKDSNILNKAMSERNAQGFLRYYVRPSFWMEYELSYGHTESGLWGLSENPLFPASEEERFDQYQFVGHNLNFFKRIKRQNIDFSLKNNLLATSNPEFRDKEHLLHSELDISKSFKKGWNIDLESDYNDLISTINGSINTRLWTNRMSISKVQKSIGFNISGLHTYERESRILPEAELYFMNKNNTLNLFYKYDIEFNSFSSTQEELFLQNRRMFNASITEQKSYGFSYEYSKPEQFTFYVSAEDIDLKDDLIWINDPNDPQRFIGQLMSYGFYDLNLKYAFHFNERISFTQNGNVNILKEFEVTDIPHFQLYQISSSLGYSTDRLRVKLSYSLGDKVYYSKMINNYAIESDYQHEVAFEFNYELSKATSLKIRADDILDNRFARFGGYADFGRRFSILIDTKF